LFHFTKIISDKSFNNTFVGDSLGMLQPNIFVCLFFIAFLTGKLKLLL